MTLDAAARRSARTRFDRPVALEAGAGTGKTTTLVARLLAWLTGPGWERAELDVGTRDPARIARAALRGSVAITFTEAAAAEMHERLALELARLAAGKRPPGAGPDEYPEPAPRRAALLRDALEEPAAQTIHSFARSLLARFPLEAGLLPGFAVDAEGRERERVVRELVEETLGEILAHELDPRWAALFREQVAPQDLEPVLLELLAAGATADDLAAPRYDVPGIARWLEELSAALSAALDALAPFAGARDLMGPVHATLQGIASALAELEARSPEHLEAWIRAQDAALPENQREKLRAWARGDFGSREAQQLGSGRGAAQLACSVLWAQLAVRLDERPALYEHARLLLGPLVGAARQRLRAANVLGFQDLLVEARALLGNPRVRRALQAEIRHLAVDEFQDTDALQCEIVAALACDAAAPERPALFLVGDPKQSIYAWRGADLAAYEGFLEGLGAGAVRAALTVNFRSSAPVLASVERWVAPRMTAEPGLQPGYQPLHAARGDTPLGPALEFWIPWDTAASGRSSCAGTGQGRAQEIEAAMLVRDLETRNQAGTRWKEFALLVRTRAHIPRLVEALRARGIPHEVAGDRSYYRRREIVDALSWIAAAIDPTDTVALLGALRSSACGLPDAALPALWAEGFPGAAARLGCGDPAALAELRRIVRAAAPHVPAAVGGRALPAAWDAALLDALETLQGLREALRTQPLDAFLEFLRRRTLFEACESARYQGEWRAQNLQRLFARLERFLEEHQGDLDRLLSLVREDLAREREQETAQPEELDTDAVRVLTIHKAKGLEFRHVYLLGLSRRSGRNARRPAELERSGGAAECVLFGMPGPRWHALAARRARIRAAEEVRTLYVGLTRAKDRLVLSGVWRSRPPDVPPAQPTLLELVCAGVAPEWYAAIEAAARGQGELPGEERVRLRLPAPEELGELESKAPPRAEPRPVRLDAALWQARRAAARQHAAQPWTQSPSGLAPEEPGGSPRSSAPASARAAGSALHAALERWDFQADPALERARLARRFPAAAALLERFAAGALFARFLEAGANLVARELAFVAPPPAGRAACALSGSMDLVFRDREGRLVVVDYKTDAVSSASEIDARAAHHAPQLVAYVEALAAGLPQEPAPRGELWFLFPGALRTIP